MKHKIKAKVLLGLFVMSGLISQLGNCSPVSATSKYGEIPGVCPFLLEDFDTRITATYENKYHNVQEYFDYVDSHGKPRIMLIGGEHVSLDHNISTDPWYENVGGAENYFFVNCIPHTKPDFTCCAERDEILQLGIGQWDGIIFENCNITIYEGKAAQNAFRLLKPGGRLLSYNVFEKDYFSVSEFFERHRPNPREYWLHKLGIRTELATVTPETHACGTLWNPIHEGIRIDSDTMIVVTKK